VSEGQTSLAGSRGRASVGGLGNEVFQKLKLFCETTIHNICVKIQQTTVYLGVHYYGHPPFINIGGTCPNCHIGIDAPAVSPRVAPSIFNLSSP